MKKLVNICDLYPNDSHKSFYGKAKVKIYSDNTKVLLWDKLYYIGFERIG